MATNDPTSPFIRGDFATLPPYAAVQPLDVLAKEIGMPESALVKLDANENLYGPLPQIREAMARAVDMHIYPDPAQGRLREALGAYVNVPPAMVLGGVGSDELLDLLMRLVFRPNDTQATIIISSPTFGMYDFLGKIAGVKVVDVPRGPWPDFAVDVNAVMKRMAEIPPTSTGLVFLTSPNNPTGGLIPDADILKMCAAAKNCVVALDEAYAEFAMHTTVPLVTARTPNLVVFRTFSKWAALAGMRVGFCVAHPRVIDRMVQIKQPYNLNAAAEEEPPSLQKRRVCYGTWMASWPR
jgi:histidinol-phosphate aminotransferase